MTDRNRAIPPGGETRHLSGQVLRIAADGGGYNLHLSGKLTGNMAVRPIAIDGERRFLFYRLG